MDPVILHGGPTAGNPMAIEMPKIEAPRTGFDVLVQEYLILATLSTLAAELASSLPKGRVHPELSEMWIVDTRIMNGEGGFFRIEATYAGRLADKRFDVRTGATAQQASTDSGNISVGLLYPYSYPDGYYKCASTEALPTWSVAYLHNTSPSQGDLAQNYTIISTGLKSGYPTPPDSPDPFWYSIPDPIYVYPAGWVLDDRSVDEIIGETGDVVLTSVQDHWQFYHQKRLT